LNLLQRISMQELALASHPASIGGVNWNATIPPKGSMLLSGKDFGILITNGSEQTINIELACQVLTQPARELIAIAHPEPINMEFVKAIAQQCFYQIRRQQGALVDDGTIAASVVQITEMGGGQYELNLIHRCSLPN
jgi:hypothetical protein